MRVRPADASIDSPTMRILFIDDEPKAGELFSRYAGAEGHDCQVFQHPLEALEHFERHGADLVVTDLRMPGLHGLDLLQRIRALDGGVPVLVITGFSSEDGAIEALRVGASNFIRKPFDPDELLAAIDRYAGGVVPGGHRAIDADRPSLAELEKRYILKTLDRMDGNREKTAAALGVDKSTLWRKLKSYETDRLGEEK